MNSDFFCKFFTGKISKRLRVPVLFFLIVFSGILISKADSAIIEGRIYSWESFEPVNKCVVTINSTPAQKIVAVNGGYSFNVPPGVYRIEVICYTYQNLYATEIVEVTKNGTFQIDILAQPPLEDLNINITELNFSVDDKSKDFGNMRSSTEMNYFYFAFFFIVLSAGIGIYHHFTRKKRSLTLDEKVLPEDLNEIIEIIRKEGGRITQKELKKRTGYSDAKISLMIADLEKRGKVEKIKKGRGNIIFLKE